MIPNKFVVSTKKAIVTGLMYNIKSSNGLSLCLQENENNYELVLDKLNLTITSQNFQWALIETDVFLFNNPTYTISTISRDSTLVYLVLTNQNQVKVMSLEQIYFNKNVGFRWSLEMSQFNNQNMFNIVNKRYNMPIMISKNKVQSSLNGKTESDWDWSFEPFWYPNVELSSFTFPDDLEKRLSNKKQVDFLDTHVVYIDNNSIGSSISRTYSKVITNHFAIELNENIGITTTLSGGASLPFVASVDLSFSASLDLGAKQVWSDSTTYFLSTTMNLVSNANGTYEMNGWVEIIDNLNLPYTCEATINVKGFRINKEGKLVSNKAKLLDVDAIISYFVKEELDVKKISKTNVNEKYVTMNITGTLSGTYGIGTQSSFLEVLEVKKNE